MIHFVENIVPERKAAYHWKSYNLLHDSSIGSDNGLAPNRRQAIIWTNGDLDYWRIYASLGLNELNGLQNLK